MAALSTLPSELQLETLDLVLHLDRGEVFENSGQEGKGFPGTIHTPILTAEKQLHLIGLEILYGRNSFKFTSANDIRQFTKIINAYQSLSSMIRHVELEVNVFSWEVDEWTEYVGSGDFGRDFLNLKLIDIDFTTFRGFAQSEFLSPMGTTHFDLLVEAFRSNVKADIAKVWGIWGDGADIIADSLEDCMTRGGTTHMLNAVGPETNFGFPDAVSSSYLEEEQHAEDLDHELGFW
ncbi:MAG: hypothetical protein Q9187_002444 [Circinaria calcarea]